MSGDMIRLTLGDWQWNAAIIGFINIVGQENVRFVELDTIEFLAEILNGFEDKYFAYLINTYEKTLSWYKIVSFQERLYAYEESDFEGFDLKMLQRLNAYIKDVKYYIKSNSYKAAYKLIDSDADMLELERQLSTIKEPKEQQKFDRDKSKIIIKLKQLLPILQKVIAYCEDPISKRYIGAKNVIYTVINNAWDGISFLNPQTNEKEVYIDYKTHFIDPVTDYLKSKKDRYRFNCFICDAPMRDMNIDLGFLRATGFDVARKSSHVWNFQNDIAVCPICKLIYSCLPAGMTYIYDRGIYINANIDIRDALNINFLIKRDILSLQEGGGRSVYHALVNALHEKENNTAKYELADIQVVRYEKGSYRFNILSRKMLENVFASKKELDSLVKTAFSENGVSVQIYDEVISRIFNSQNLFTLIHRMLYYKLSDPLKCYFNGSHVNHLLRVNQRIYTSLGGIKVEKTLEHNSVDYIGKANLAGYHLRTEYIDKGSANKLPGICYRLLNALKASNADMFMDVLLNCYLYVNRQVPKVVTDVLGKENVFNTMGYAFVAGMIDGQDTREDKAKKVKGEEK